MLYHVRVENIALIDEAELDLSDGLNVITGETGAGKSILLGAINLALGARAGRDMVREAGKKAQVTLMFQEDHPALLQKLSELEIPAEGGEVTLVKRFMENGRSVSYINDQIVTASTLKEISSGLIDIHGQHEHQSLLNASKHIDLLDRFIGGIEEELSLMRRLFAEHEEIRKKIQHYEENGRDRERLLDLMSYEAQEIEEINWQEGEEERLVSERKRLLHAEKLSSATQKAYQLLLGESGGAESAGAESALSLLDQALSYVSSVEGLDEAFFAPYEKSLEEQSVLLTDIGRALRDYAEGVDMDARSLEQIEERYDQILKLKQKYGDSREKVLAYLSHIQEEVESLTHLEETLEALRKEEKTLCRQMEEQAKRLHESREAAAGRLEGEITEVLSSLEFKDPLFEVRLEPKEIGPKGLDQVVFCIRTNVGEGVKPLHQIASGGEMSRIMLAIKAVLARQDEIGTLIFDEIDTGISGRTAQSVAMRMHEISRFHQVICVTHLPQIAAMADQHLHIEKEVRGSRTSTFVKALSGQEVIAELSRMLGGAKITKTVEESAREMKELAQEWKKESSR